MMTAPIRAVYENGTLRLLMPVDLEEGQEVQIAIVPIGDPLVAALGDLVVKYAPIDLPEIDETALQREIDLACVNKPSVSEAILEERHSSSDNVRNLNLT
jgi:predicted DNA-binding antitoxin AbrB/MazE fold protein